LQGAKRCQICHCKNPETRRKNSDGVKAYRRTGIKKSREKEPRYCVTCGIKLTPQDGWKYCLDCRPKQNFCTDCGVEISLSAERCQNCDTIAQWLAGIHEDQFSEESRRKLIASLKAARARGAWNSKETRRKLSKAMKAQWAAGTFDNRSTKEYRRKISRANYRSWARGDRDGESTRRKWSRKAEAQWARGDMDGVFQSPTSIELKVSAALDICGIEHQPQYRPDGYSRVYDEFIPPNILIEVHGDYWHNLEGAKQRDAEKAAWAKKHGYHLVIIWEHEIEERGAWAIVLNRVSPITEPYAANLPGHSHIIQPEDWIGGRAITLQPELA
jgi:G:T-mismatch repair DNA endonuclease (very short patch repair protein)